MSRIFKFLIQDWSANKNNTKGKFFTLLFRFVNLSTKSHLLFILLFPIRIFYKLLFELIIGIEIPYDTIICKGLRVYHLQSIVINKNVVIGENCTLRQSTTIGNKVENGLCPIISNNVDIGANVCIIGNIVIGDNVIIGAGSIVTKNLPAHSVAVGNPARIIKFLK